MARRVATLRRPAATKARAKGRKAKAKAESQPAQLKPEDVEVRAVWSKDCHYTLVRGHFEFRTFEFVCNDGHVITVWDKSGMLQQTLCPDERPSNMREVFELKLKYGRRRDLLSEAIIHKCKFRGYQPVRNLPTLTRS